MTEPSARRDSRTDKIEANVPPFDWGWRRFPAGAIQVRDPACAQVGDGDLAMQNGRGRVAMLGLLILPALAKSQGGLLDNDVDRLLRKWHEKTKPVTNLYAEFTRVKKTISFGDEVVQPGSARFLQPCYGRLDVKPQTNANPKAGPEAIDKGESFIVTEKPGEGGKKQLEVWHYNLAEKQVQITEFKDRQNVGNPQEEGPLKLMFGMDPKRAQAQYQIQILADGSHEVGHGKQRRKVDGIRVRIVPKIEELKQEFLWAEMTLNRKSYMPIELVVKENLDTMVAYDFGDNIMTNLPVVKGDGIHPTDFEPWVPPSKSWRMTRQSGKTHVSEAPADLKPRRALGAREPDPRR
jgi:hypothetical protein